ncbi:EAL domain-containing protein [Vibrio sonorensis]|uniref:EAL domain-containing protein n=1 Tax=Vibrio sonorensis TaxID=1004316 RepID=UPI0008D9E17C|nr:EAL domain-containing protein [Vibrio sonorensis]
MKQLTSFLQTSFKRYYFAFLFILLGNGLLVLSVVFHANKEVASSNYLALSKVDQNLNRIKNSFGYLLQNHRLEQSCDELLVKLRQGVFNTRMVKEAAVFNSNGRFFCSSNKGHVSFPLFNQYREALVENYPKPTLSYLKTAIIRSHALALMFTDESGSGISVLIPPSYLYQILNTGNDSQNLYFELTIGGKTLNAYEGKLPKVLNWHQAKSQNFAIELTNKVGFDYYLDHLASAVWLNILLTSLIITAYVMGQRSQISRNSLEFALTNALRKGYFECHYQPIYRAQGKQLIGCEALLRWNDPVRGFVSPEIFIPLAEKLNLIDRLTEIVIDLTMSMLLENQQAFAGKYISINISRRSLLNGRVIDWVEMLELRYPKLRHQIVFEITEKGEFDERDMKAAKRALDVIERAGMRIAIDDFGTGYSGLDFIAQLPFSIMKIDRVFVNNLTNQSAIVPVLKSMLNLAQSRSMAVIVEGVEDKRQLDILTDIGFEYIQGYFFDRPMPSNQLLEKLDVKTEVDQAPAFSIS